MKDENENEDEGEEQEKYDGFLSKEDCEELYYGKWFEDRGTYSFVK